MPDPQPPAAPGKVLPGFLGSILLMVPMAVAWAEPATVDVFADTRYSDNINKNEQNPLEEFEHRVGLSINKNTDPGRCQGSASGDIAFVHYQRDTNDDEVVGTLTLDGECQPNPWFRWDVRNTTRDVRRDTTNPDAPANRQRRNVFSTGPTFIWPVTQRDDVSLSLEYQMTRFERTTGDDADRYTATTRWQRLFTAQLRGGLQASRSDIDLRRSDEELLQDNVSAFFNYQRGRGVWSGQIGQSWLESEQGPFRQRTSATTGNLRYNHQWDAGTSAYIEGRRSLTDASTDIDLEIEGLSFNLTETSGVQVTAVNTGITQPWTERTRTSLQLTWTESDYERSGTREERYTANMRNSHRLTETLSGNWNLGYDREDFDVGNTLVHTYRTSLGLDYQRTRDLSLNAGVGYESRDIEGGAGNRFDERWIRIGLRYNLR